MELKDIMAKLEEMDGKLSRIEKGLNIGKTASDVLKESMDTWKPSPPQPKPEPKGKITYPVSGSMVIANIPTYYTYKAEVGDMPSWYVDGRLVGPDGGQVAFEVTAGEHTVSAVVDGKVVDSIKVMGFVPER